MCDGKTIKEKMIYLTDTLASLSCLMQKLDTLSNDFCYTYLENIDMNTESGIESAKHEMKLIKTMGEIIHDFSNDAARICASLPDLSESILEQLY